MPASQNGWKANDRSVISTRLIPGTGRSVAVRNGAAGDLLLEVAARFDREVEDVDQGADDWGYAERPIRGGTELSNHASGTAIDLNATKHPLGTAASANFTRAQIDAIHRILAAAQGCVRWGGDYTGRGDPMHFEILDGRTEADCARALASLRGVAPVAVPTQPANVRLLLLTTPNMRGDDVKALQRKLGLTADGIFGPKTDRAVRAAQKAHNLSVDGKVGPVTRRALGLG